jgi:hypothetical protein
MVRTRDLLSRFHQLLVEKIRRSVPEYLSGEFTVAEIYQTLVPYADHRDRLGIEMSSDYELALLRLLAGEGDFLQLQADPARQRLRRELETSSPNLGLYREYAALGVRLNPAFIEVSPSSGAPSPPPPAPPPPPAAPPTAAGRSRDSGAHRIAMSAPATPEIDVFLTAGSAVRPAPPPPPREEPPLATPPVEAEVLAPTAKSGDCPGCHHELPARASLRFCPHCGVNVRERPCPTCQEVLEWSWGFCIACGHKVRKD